MKKNSSKLAGFTTTMKELFGLDNSEGAGVENDIENGIINIETEDDIIKNVVEEKEEKIVSKPKYTKKSEQKIKINEVKNEAVNYQTIFVDPRSYADCNKIVEYIKSDKMVTLNLEYMEDDVAVRLMNFISGSMTIKEATFLVIANKVYTIIPKNMQVYYEGKKVIKPRIFTNFRGEGK